MDAAARLYDVDEDSVVFTKLEKTKEYDQGVFTFRARKGKLIDLDKLHESIWATRLSGGTRSGLVSLEVVAIGEVINTQNGSILKVAGVDSEFKLAKGPDDENATAFEQLVSSSSNVDSSQIVKVTGVIDNYKGRWPTLLQKKPDRVRTILVTGYEVLNDVSLTR